MTNADVEARKPMSTSSTIAGSSAPSANHAIIRVGLIGVGNPVVSVSALRERALAAAEIDQEQAK